MAVFNAIGRSAGQIAAGLAGRAVKSALGLNRAPGTGRPAPLSGPVMGSTTDRPNETYQYPLDLATPKNGHFILFTCKQQTKKTETKVGGTNLSQSTLEDISGGDRAEFGGGFGAGGRPGFSPAERRSSIQAASAAVATNTARNLNSSLGARSGPGSIQLKSKPATGSGPYIAMYMPPTVSEVYSLRYNDIDIGPWTQLGADIYEQFKDTNADNFWKEMSNYLKDNEKTGIKDATNAKLAQMARAAAPGVSAAVAIHRGIVFTPKMELMFEGLNRRQFAFSFVMMPSSKDEADMINEIIYQFKVNSAPDYADSLGMQMTIPHRWAIEYYNTGTTGAPSTNGYLTKMDECFLENIQVTYGGDKYVAHEPNAAGAPPTRVAMSLTFRELELQTKSRLENKNHSMPTSGSTDLPFSPEPITGGSGFGVF